MSSKLFLVIIVYVCFLMTNVAIAEEPLDLKTLLHFILDRYPDDHNNEYKIEFSSEVGSLAYSTSSSEFSVTDNNKISIVKKCKIVINPHVIPLYSINAQAFLLAHEVAHYQLNHSQKFITNYKNSWMQEYDADARAGHLLILSGYDPILGLKNLIPPTEIGSTSHPSKISRLASLNGIRRNYEIENRHMQRLSSN